MVKEVKRILRLLVTTGDFSRWHSRGSHYLWTELGKISHLTLWFDSGDINEIVAGLPEKPDFILINEFNETNSPKITGLANLQIPYGVYLHDLHHRVQARKEELKQEKVKWIFSHYRNRYFEWYPEFAEGFRWLPKHIYTPVFRDYGQEKDIDYLLMGAVHEYLYPLRFKVLKTMQGMPGFVYHEHAGMRNFADDEDAFVGEKYARELNRAKIFFTCDSRYNYPVSKYFEALACRTLLLAPESDELVSLGFIPGVNFVAINKDNFLDRAVYYLQNERKRNEITRQGYYMIHSQHTSYQRAIQLVKMIEDIIGT